MPSTSGRGGVELGGLAGGRGREGGGGGRDAPGVADAEGDGGEVAAVDLRAAVGRRTRKGRDAVVTLAGDLGRRLLVDGGREALGRGRGRVFGGDHVEAGASGSDGDGVSVGVGVERLGIFADGTDVAREGVVPPVPAKTHPLTLCAVLLPHGVEAFLQPELDPVHLLSLARVTLDDLRDPARDVADATAGRRGGPAAHGRLHRFGGEDDRGSCLVGADAGEVDLKDVEGGETFGEAQHDFQDDAFSPGGIDAQRLESGEAGRGAGQRLK